MSFSYSNGANPRIDNPRLLLGDTVDLNHVFEDAEIESAYTIIASGSSAVSVLRVAALLLDAQAARLSRRTITDLQDVQRDSAGAARSLREQAAQYRAVDDDATALGILRLNGCSWIRW